MERGLNSPAFAAVSEGRTRYLVLDEALICADTHPVTMHAFHGISAQLLLCQWLRVRVRHRCLGALSIAEPSPSRLPPAGIQQPDARLAAPVSRPRAYG